MIESPRMLSKKNNEKLQKTQKTKNKAKKYVWIIISCQ